MLLFFGLFVACDEDGLMESGDFGLQMRYLNVEVVDLSGVGGDLVVEGVYAVVAVC